MYQVTVQTFNKKGKEMVDHITVSLGEMDEPGYDDAMHQLTDLLFGLDVDYDDVEDVYKRQYLKTTSERP